MYFPFRNSKRDAYSAKTCSTSLFRKQCTPNVFEFYVRQTLLTFKTCPLIINACDETIINSFLSISREKDVGSLESTQRVYCSHEEHDSASFTYKTHRPVHGGGCPGGSYLDGSKQGSIFKRRFLIKHTKPRRGGTRNTSR